MKQGLAVGFIPDVKQLAFMDYKIDSQDTSNLDAVWALGGFTSLGTEILKAALSFFRSIQNNSKPSEQPLCLRHAESRASDFIGDRIH